MQNRYQSNAALIKDLMHVLKDLEMKHFCRNDVKYQSETIGMALNSHAEHVELA